VNDEIRVDSLWTESWHSVARRRFNLHQERQRFGKPVKDDPLEFYCSENGDRWLLGEDANESPVVRHIPNARSGGVMSDVPVAMFLSSGKSGPQYDAFRRMHAGGDLRRSSFGAAAPAAAVSMSPVIADALLLAAARVRTYARERPLTNASGFFFRRGQRLFLVTSRHVVCDEPGQHFPDRLEIELHVDPDNLGASSWLSLPLYASGLSLWRQGTDSGGEIDIAAIEVPRDRLPHGALFNAFGPEHLPSSSDALPIGASLLIVGFPLGFHDSLHHLPIVRQAVLASAYRLRFQGKGCFISDARTHRGMSGAPVVMSRSPTGAGGAVALPWMLLGVHSSTIDMGDRDVQLDDPLGLNSAWYSDILMILTSDA
jgi:hypothetical protein